MHALRRLGLQGTQYAKAQVTTMREKFLKIGAQIKVSVRRVFLSMASGCPYAKTFFLILKNLQKNMSLLRT